MAGEWNTQGVIHETGTTYNFVSNEQIEAGMLDTPKHRLLFLTESYAMSEEEAEQIRSWVMAGGIVVADLAPAIATKRGRLLKKGLLDELFGVDRTKAELVKKESVIRPGKSVLGIALGGEVKVTAYEKGLVATTAAAAAMEAETETPAIFVNKAGKGLAVLLNSDPFLGYRDVSAGREEPDNAKRAGALDALFRCFLDAADIEPLAQIVADDGKLVDHTYFAKFDAGDVTYLGVIHGSDHVDENRGARPPRAVTIKLPKKSNVYDVLEDKTYADTDSLHVSMPYMFVKILALVPYEVKGLETDLPESTKAGDVLRFDLSISASDEPSDHVVRMEVDGPDGEERWYLAQNILAKNGRAQVTLPFALNDPAGEWTIRFHDVTSGKRLERTIELLPSSESEAERPKS